MDDKGNPFALVEPLCQLYHWPLSQATKLTLPQIILLNHAAWVGHENADRKYEAKKAKGQDREEYREDKREMERVANMEGPALTAYLMDWS